jgi:cadmium resistance transport/sequestration family protein
MSHWLADTVTAVLVFTATNVDDVFLLLAFFADRRYRHSSVVLGQYVGIAVLVGISAVASLVSLIVRPEWLGLLGLIPLGLGIRQWFERQTPDDDDESSQAPLRNAVLTVASITIANGGDNIGVYTPLFASLTGARIVTICVVFAIMTGLWCAVAVRMVQHPSWGPSIRRYSALLLPWVLIALGLWIIIDMGTLGLLR